MKNAMDFRVSSFSDPGYSLSISHDMIRVSLPGSDVSDFIAEFRAPYIEEHFHAFAELAAHFYNAGMEAGRRSI
jgi:hypothetical protein